MALTELQRDVCHLLAEQRIRSGESYVAGGVALNELLGGRRISRDVDLFHDTEDAVEASWTADRAHLEAAGFGVQPLRERPGFVEAVVRKGDQSARLEWARDSAFRFFPLVEHPDLGLALHPFDLATNKLLAMIGRREVRDWVDLLLCDEALQPLGYLAWAACGKDPGFSPEAILAHAERSGRYSAQEVAELAFAPPPPDPGDLSRKWRTALRTGHEIVETLPPEEAGACVLYRNQELCRLAGVDLELALDERQIAFRTGSIRGALPTIRSR